MKKVAPCRGCEERKVGCHSACPKGYTEWKEWLEEKKEETRRRRALERGADAYVNDAKRRMKKRYGKGTK